MSSTASPAGATAAVDAAAATTTPGESPAECSFTVHNPNAPQLVVPLTLPAVTSVLSLKQHLESHYPSHPSVEAQRLICEGRLVRDEETLGAVLAAAPPDRQRLHLAVRGQSTVTSPTNAKQPQLDASQQTRKDSGNDSGTTATKQTGRVSPSTTVLDSPPPLTNQLAASVPLVSLAQPHAHVGHYGAAHACHAGAAAPAATPLHPYAAPYFPYTPFASYPPYAAPTAAATSYGYGYGGSRQSSDQFGLRQRHSSGATAPAGSGSGSSSSSRASASPSPTPVATPAQLEAHAQAMAVYQIQLQQYHAMCAAMQAQYQQQMYMAHVHGQGTAPLLHAHAFHGAQPIPTPASPMLPMHSSNSGLFYRSTSGTPATAASVATGSTVAAGATPAPAGSILAALTRASSQPQQQQQPLAPPHQQHLDAIREALRAMANTPAPAAAAAGAAGANAIPGAAPAAPAAAAGAAPAAAGAAPAVPAAAAAAGGGAAAPRGRFARYINVKLMLKFVVLFILFSQGEDGDWQRSAMLAVASVLLYLWQVGAFRRAGPDEPQVQADDDDMDFMAAGAGAGGGAGGIGAQLPPRPDRPAAAPAQAAVANPPAAVAVPAAPQGFVTNAEKFIVGFFASLMPTWRPVPVPARPPPPPAAAEQQQQQQQPPVVPDAPAVAPHAEAVEMVPAADAREPEPQAAAAQ